MQSTKLIMMYIYNSNREQAHGDTGEGKRNIKMQKIRDLQIKRADMQEKGRRERESRDAQALEGKFTVILSGRAAGGNENRCKA